MSSELWNTENYDQWIQEGCPENLKVSAIFSRLYKIKIPREIGLLSNLRELDLSFNAITSIPVEIGVLQNLEILDLSCNKIDSFPVELGNLIKLLYLDLSSNAITSLPTSFGNLHALETLNLSQTGLTSFPQGICNMRNLKVLSMCTNRLTYLPLEIGNLQNLNSLFLEYNNIISFPQGICNMRNLKLLSMCINSITSLPPEIGNLQNLEILNLSGNTLTSLPPEIGNLLNLEILNLSNNTLTSLPPEIGNITNLYTLLTAGNEITYIPRNVRRIIERQRHAQGIYRDVQSVHNSTIQRTIKESIMRLLKERETHRDIIELILSDTVLDDFTKESLVEYSGDTSIHTELNLTFHDLLVIVWNRIVVLPNSAEIKAVLNAEMSDARCMCFTGRISRLVNCLNGFDPLVTIQISDNEQIGNIISLVKTQLKDKNEYTVERHKDVVRTRLEELGIVAEEIEAWLEHIE